MSEALTREDKKAILKDIILKLHGGLSATEARDRFEKEVGNISSTEIAELEQSLINDGLSPDEIKKFCNVHALIFQSALAEATIKETAPSHPIFLFKAENREVEKLVEGIKKTVETRSEADVSVIKSVLKDLLAQLKGVETHYERKEQVLFPFLEKKNFMGPSKVMWGKDNEVRDLFRAAFAGLDGVVSQAELTAYIEKKLNPLIEEVTGMIFKEENILFPTSLEKLDPGDWVEILRESDRTGYVFIRKPAEVSELIKHLEESLAEETLVQDGAIKLPTGVINLGEMAAILNALPVDLTFVDKDDTVRYFSDGKTRIFHRSRAIIGRKVQNCHPPQSVDVVEKILTSFKQGTKDEYEFWLTIQGKLVYIRYFAVRDASRNYLGTLEVTQDITGVKKLEGERRLLDERA